MNRCWGLVDVDILQQINCRLFLCGIFLLSVLRALMVLTTATLVSLEMDESLDTGFFKDLWGLAFFSILGGRAGISGWYWKVLRDDLG